MKLARELLSFVVPPLCAACREPEFSGEAVCPACRGRLVGLPAGRCRGCGAPQPVACATCRECRGRALAFSSAWAPFAYAGVARQVVASLKTGGMVRLAELAGAEIAGRAPEGLLAGTLVPVPAHRRRRTRHGFNQAALIARALAREASLPVSNLLERANGTAPQVGLERRDRIANVHGSVRLRARAAAPQRAVLVDDVYTTGATLDACARPLLRAGAGEVVALTFARAVRG